MAEPPPSFRERSLVVSIHVLRRLPCRIQVSGIETGAKIEIPALGLRPALYLRPPTKPGRRFHLTGQGAEHSQRTGPRQRYRCGMVRALSEWSAEHLWNAAAAIEEFVGEMVETREAAGDSNGDA